LYDHKTQIYVNDSEGLKLDHKFNNINIKEDSINLNLKDNNGWINIGTQNSNQRAILGDNFTNWFDEFLDILIGKSGGFALGNLATPVQASPALITHIQKYFSIKTSKILSQHVKIVDNDYVDTQKRTDNVSEGVKGDKWASTVEDNKLTTKEEVKFKPVEGPSNTTFDKPPVDSNTPVAKEDLKPNTTPITDISNTITPISSTPSVATETGPIVEGERNPDVDVLIQLLKNKNYKIYDRPYEMNIVAVRNQCLSKGQNYTNDFCDDIYIFYADELNKWHIKKYKYSTMPGSEFTLTENWLKEQNLPESENEYWKTKINKKVTLKEFYKGPPKTNTLVTPTNESLLIKKDGLKEVSGLSSNNSVLNSFLNTNTPINTSNSVETSFLNSNSISNNISDEKNSENKDVKIMSKDEIIKFIKSNNYEKEIANKDIKSFNQERFLISNSISKTKSAASLSATDMMNKYIVDNKVSGLSTDSTTYLKENNGNIDYLHIKPLEK
jgi:hypothetical protein